MEVKIKDLLILKPLKNGNWMVAEDFRFYVNGILYTIPEGFETDLGSVPKAFRWIIGTHQKKTVGYTIHDFFYRTIIEGIDRKFADSVMKEVFNIYKVGKVKTSLIYRVLRLTGWKAWNSYR